MPTVILKKKLQTLTKKFKIPVSRVVMVMTVILNKFALCFDLYKLNYSRIYKKYIIYTLLEIRKTAYG